MCIMSQKITHSKSTVGFPYDRCFPSSDVPGIQSSILCFYHNLADYCVHLHQSRGKNGKIQFYMGWHFIQKTWK